MKQSFIPSLLFSILLSTRDTSAEIKIAILMQGSDFINVSIVPTYDVNQFDLGDVFISPCRGGTYNDKRDSYCKDCSVCTSYQYEEADCITTRNRVCPNCTICTEREQEKCACQQRDAECITGNRICLPLPASLVNISFDLTVGAVLPPIKERFLLEGLRTGFILYLSDFLKHPPESISLMYMQKTSSRTYNANLLVNDVYSLVTKRQVELLTQDIVQSGLTSTFGTQSNTFSTVSQQRRRRLLKDGGITLTVEKVDATCSVIGECSRFFVMTTPPNPCDAGCVALPCPPGYTGLYGMCEICPNATFKALEGGESCTACPKGATSDQGSTSLDSCWVPTTTAKPTTTTFASALPTTTPLSWPVGPTSMVMLTSVTLPRTTTSSRQQTLLATELLTSTQRGGTTTTLSSTPTSTSPGGGGGGWVPSGLVNMTTINNFYAKYIWNSGHAGAVQYIIIQNSREQWAVNMVGFLMLGGLFAISVIGARVLIEWPRHPSYSRLVPKREIQLPIRLPDPESSGSDDDHAETKRRKSVFPAMPKGGFLGQRRFSRSLDSDY